MAGLSWKMANIHGIIRIFAKIQSVKKFCKIIQLDQPVTCYHGHVIKPGMETGNEMKRNEMKSAFSLLVDIYYHSYDMLA